MTCIRHTIDYERHSTTKLTGLRYLRDGGVHQVRSKLQCESHTKKKDTKHCSINIPRLYIIQSQWQLQGENFDIRNEPPSNICLYAGWKRPYLFRQHIPISSAVLRCRFIYDSGDKAYSIVFWMMYDVALHWHLVMRPRL